MPSVLQVVRHAAALLHCKLQSHIFFEFGPAHLTQQLYGHSSYAVTGSAGTQTSTGAGMNTATMSDIIQQR